MNSITHQRHWLYLLTALVLLMQSFALWHDASHPFHIAETPCQQFESISHTPALDLAVSVTPQFVPQLTAVESVVTQPYRAQRLREHHTIRAPPVFS